MLSQMVVPKKVYLCRKGQHDFTKVVDKTPYKVGFKDKILAEKASYHLNGDVHVYLRPRDATTEMNNMLTSWHIKHTTPFKNVRVEPQGQLIVIKNRDVQNTMLFACDISDISYHQFLLDCHRENCGVAVVYDIYRENPYNIIYKAQFIEPFQHDEDAVKTLGVLLSFWRTLSFISNNFNV